MGTVWYAQTDIETERDPTSFIKRFDRFKICRSTDINLKKYTII